MHVQWFHHVAEIYLYSGTCIIRNTKVSENLGFTFYHHNFYVYENKTRVTVTVYVNYTII